MKYNKLDKNIDEVIAYIDDILLNFADPASTDDGYNFMAMLNEATSDTYNIKPILRDKDLNSLVKKMVVKMPPSIKSAAKESGESTDYSIYEIVYGNGKMERCYQIDRDNREGNDEYKNVRLVQNRLAALTGDKGQAKASKITPAETGLSLWQAICICIEKTLEKFFFIDTKKGTIALDKNLNKPSLKLDSFNTYADLYNACIGGRASATSTGGKGKHDELRERLNSANEIVENIISVLVDAKNKESAKKNQQGKGNKTKANYWKGLLTIKSAQGTVELERILKEHIKGYFVPYIDTFISNIKNAITTLRPYTNETNVIKNPVNLKKIGIAPKRIEELLDHLDARNSNEVKDWCRNFGRFIKGLEKGVEKFDECLTRSKAIKNHEDDVGTSYTGVFSMKDLCRRVARVNNFALTGSFFGRPNVNFGYNPDNIGYEGYDNRDVEPSYYDECTCPDCGVLVDEGSKFCSECGASLS